MLFFCAYFDWASPDCEPTLQPMLSARRVAIKRTVATIGMVGGALAHAADCCVEAQVGGVRAFLLRPRASLRAAEGAVLDRILQTYTRSGRLEPLAVGGPFAIVLVDTIDRRVLVANDRFGICPVHYRQYGERLMLSSCLSAIAGSDVRPALSQQAIYDYVFFHCIPSPRTIYRDIAKLEPAARLSWSASGVVSEPYWRPDFAAARAAGETSGPALLAALEQAVEVRAQNHCGAFLSGGLDSSSVAGMLKRSTGEASTFTIGFDAPGYDESAYARLAANHFGATHHEYFLTPADVRDSLTTIAAHYSEPFGNSSVIPTYYCARYAREHGIEVLLAGDGGDELFAGNTRYIEQEKFDRYTRLPAALRAGIELGYRALPILERLPVSGKGARYIRQVEMGLPDRLQSYNFLHRYLPERVFDSEWLANVETQAPWLSWRQRYAEPATGDALQRMLYLDWKFTLADNDLVKVNNMCELAGIEVCYPMLADEVVDLAVGMNSASLLEGGRLRGFYKRAVGDFLPKAIVEKSKHGFGLPFGLWLRDDEGLRALATQALHDLRGRGIFQASFIDEALRLYRSADAPSYFGELVWILMMLELWLATH